MTATDSFTASRRTVTLPPDVLAAVEVVTATDPPPPPAVSTIPTVSVGLSDVGPARRPVALPPDVVATVEVVPDESSTTTAPPPAPAPAVTQSAAAAAVGVGLKEADYADRADGLAVPPSAPVPPGPSVALDLPRLFAIVREVAVGHSGEELHAATSADREFSTEGHDAQGRRRFGLAFGLVLFTQESGQLGDVLRLMEQRRPGLLREVLGEHADTVVEVTTRPDAAERLAPVGGEELWSPNWVARFRALGAVEECRAAQNEQAIERQLRPMLTSALALGAETERTVAAAYDAVVARGLYGGLRWVAAACGPLRSDAARVQALRLIGHQNVASFKAVQGLAADHVVDLDTYLRLLAELRRTDLLPPADPSAAMSRLVAAATGAARARLERLAASTVLTDQRVEVTS